MTNLEITYSDMRFIVVKSEVIHMVIHINWGK